MNWPGGAAATQSRTFCAFLKVTMPVKLTSEPISKTCFMRSTVSPKQWNTPRVFPMNGFIWKTRGVFHCFGETVERMKQVFEIGSLVSFTGIVTFRNAQNVRDCVAAAPPGQFMLETDCPYLAPVPYLGKRCEPAYVKEISVEVAQIKLCSPEDLSVETCKTAKDFFHRLNSNG